MPTLSKLLSAIIFAAIAFFAAEFVKLEITEGMNFAKFSEICASIGLMNGWMVMGCLVGQGYKASIGYGLRTAVTMTVWCMLFTSTALMLRKAFRQRYDGPMESLVDIFKLSIENAPLLIAPPVIGTLVLGGMIGGFAAEWAKRRWD
jgi:hypothetical protein